MIINKNLKIFLMFSFDKDIMIHKNMLPEWSHHGAAGALMSHRPRWKTPRGRYDEHNSKFFLSMKPKFNRPVGEKNHF
jgi:hypothetical protein